MNLHSPESVQMTAGEAALKFPLNARVRYFPLKGSNYFLEGQIRSYPWVLGSGHVVVKITGKSGGVSVNHLELAP